MNETEFCWARLFYVLDFLSDNILHIFSVLETNNTHWYIFFPKSSLDKMFPS